MIDFETGLVRAVQPSSEEEFLAAFGEAEGEQQRLTPEMPSPAMLDPISERLGLPSSLRASIVDWPAFDAPRRRWRRSGAATGSSP